MRKLVPMSKMMPRQIIDTPTLAKYCAFAIADAMQSGLAFTAYDLTQTMRALNPGINIPHEDVDNETPGVASIVYTLMETKVVPLGLYKSTMHKTYNAHFWMPDMRKLKAYQQPMLQLVA